MDSTTIAGQALSLNAESFFRTHPHIVDGPQRWQRAIAGRKRDQAAMRIILEGEAVQAILLLAELSAG